jgi:hypothetical protein
MTDIDTTPDATEDLPPEVMQRARIFEPWWLAVAATIFLALWLWREAGIRVRREDAISQQAEINRLTHENELLAAQLDRLAITLAGQELAPKASAKLFLDNKERRAIAYFADLPRAANYRLWMTGPDGVAVDAGTFAIPRSGRASLVVENVPEGARFVVTRGDAAAPAYLVSR